MGRETLGGFIRYKREEKHCPLGRFARKLGISAAYLSNLEQDSRHFPAGGIVSRIAELLSMNDDEKAIMNELWIQGKMLAHRRKLPTTFNNG